MKRNSRLLKGINKNVSVSNFKRHKINEVSGFYLKSIFQRKCFVEYIRFPKNTLVFYINSWKELECVWKVHSFAKFKYSTWWLSILFSRFLSLINMSLKFRLILIISNSKSVELNVKSKNEYCFASVIISINVRRYWANRKGSAGCGGTHKKEETHSTTECKSGPLGPGPRALTPVLWWPRVVGRRL